jgi:hypothetical protein
MTDGIIGRLLLDLCCGETTLVEQLGLRKHEVEEAGENVISVREYIDTVITELSIYCRI